MPAKPIDLSGIKATYPGVYYIKKNKWVLVKDGVQYIFNQERIDRMVAEVHGHYDEIVRDYKPRKRRKASAPRKPKAPPTPTKSKPPQASSPMFPQGLMASYLQEPERVAKLKKVDLRFLSDCIEDELEEIKARKKEIRKNPELTPEQKLAFKKECEKGSRLFKKLQRAVAPLLQSKPRAKPVVKVTEKVAKPPKAKAKGNTLPL
jgi:hypothetical protein